MMPFTRQSPTGLFVPDRGPLQHGVALPGPNYFVKVRFKRKICRARTGTVIFESDWLENLFLDKGLNSIAGDTTAPNLASPAASTFLSLKIGSGTNAVMFNTPGTTFTQTTTSLTSSTGFFTAAMVGAIFKYGSGTGGTEMYITAFNSSTNVTVDTSATVSTPTVGTVWMVQQTALQTQTFQTSTYQTNPGDCGSTLASGTLTHQRTFINPAQASPYTVNELGYAPVAGTNITGRLVLPSSDVVGTSNFYLVVMQFSMALTPNVPTAMGNVGTGIDTTGNAMLEATATAEVSSTGTVQLGSAFINPGIAGGMRGATATFTQNANTVQGQGSVTLPTGVAANASSGGGWAKVGGVRGQMQFSRTYSASTSGQTLFGIGIGIQSPGTLIAWTDKLTTPVTLPTGTWSGSYDLRCTYNRVLNNP